VDELKTWLERFIEYTNKKIEKMKKVVPDHRNIKRFEGEVMMAEKTINKINELNVTTSTKNRKQKP